MAANGKMTEAALAPCILPDKMQIFRLHGFTHQEKANRLFDQLQVRKYEYRCVSVEIIETNPRIRLTTRCKLKKLLGYQANGL